MKPLLLHRDRDFDPPQERSWDTRALTQDLELDTLLRGMAGDDKFLVDVARKALFAGLSNDLDTILYRQAVLQDCLKNASVVRQLYDLAVEAIENERKNYFGVLSRYPSAILHRSIDVLQMFMGMLRTLRDTGTVADRFESEGLTNLFAMLEQELSDRYLARIREHLKELKFGGGVLLSAALGKGNQGAHYVVRKATRKRPSWWSRLFGEGLPAYTFRIADRDEAGARALSELQGRGINVVANALAQSADHVLSFFETLRTELAFYVGCLNLHERLASKGEPVCFPRPAPVGERTHRFRELRDACLALHMARPVVGNSVGADGKSLVIITGPNQGGKSSFLRAIGLAQLMMQSGMFVAAESFEAELCAGLHTHYKREEDATMKSGKLDEELRRMSDIADRITAGSMLLFNESFAATNEREGSEIARQVVWALLEKRVKMFFVTHLYEFAHGVFEKKLDEAMFLRAERRADGTRTFRLVEGEPLETSYGEDLYRKIFDAREGKQEQGGPAMAKTRINLVNPHELAAVPGFDPQPSTQFFSTVPSTGRSQTPRSSRRFWERISPVHCSNASISRRPKRARPNQRAGERMRAAFVRRTRCS